MTNQRLKISWRDELETGFVVTDGRHQSLVCLYNDHIRYLNSGVSSVALQRGFYTLLNELRIHFKEDCDFIAVSGYSQADRFVREHEKIIEAVDTICRFHTDPEVIRGFTLTLRSWIENHMLWGREVANERNLNVVPPYRGDYRRQGR